MKAFQSVAAQVPSLALCLILMMGCGVRIERDDSYDYYDYTPDQNTLKDEGTCLYSPTQGETAWPVRAPEIQNLSFGKPIDLARLKAVQSTSALETVRAIRDAGIQVVQASTKQRYRCKMFDSLPSAQSWANQIWDESNSKGGLLGFFLPKRDSKNLSGAPLIVVRPDTARWTLVHEYAHALFEMELERTASSSGDDHKNTLKTLITVWEKQQKECSISTRCENSKAFQETTLKLSRAFEGLILAYYLEEIAIEHALSHAFANGSLNYVHNGLRNSESYAEASLENAAKIQAMQTEILDEFRRTTSPVQDRTEIEAFLSAENSRANTLMSDARTATRQIVTIATSKGMRAYGQARRGVTPKVPTAPCSHGGGDALVEELEGLF